MMSNVKEKQKMIENIKNNEKLLIFNKHEMYKSK